MAMKAIAVTIPVKIMASEVPRFVKNAAVLEVAISAPAISMPLVNTSLGAIGPVPDAVWPINSKLSVMAGIQKRP